MDLSRVLDHLSDCELIAEVNRLANAEHTAIANLIAGLGEMDARRLYLGQGCSSMFTYCTQVLHLAEHAAFNRIEAARAVRRFPIILTLLADLERTKFAATARPRASQNPGKRSRHVPADVRRAVWARDGGRCRFEGPAGRCGETGLLEFHHVLPFARRGSTTVDNLELRCAAHNRYEADQCFGLLVRESAEIYSSAV